MGVERAAWERSRHEHGSPNSQPHEYRARNAPRGTNRGSRRSRRPGRALHRPRRPRARARLRRQERVRRSAVRCTTWPTPGSASSCSRSSRLVCTVRFLHLYRDQESGQQDEPPCQRRVLGRRQRLPRRARGELLVHLEVERRLRPDRQDVDSRGDGHARRPIARRRRWTRPPRIRRVSRLARILRRPPWTSGPARSSPERDAGGPRLSRIGNVAAILGFIGVLVLIAAIQHDPNETEGIDGALKRLLAHGWGEVALHRARLRGVRCVLHRAGLGEPQTPRSRRPAEQPYVPLGGCSLAVRLEDQQRRSDAGALARSPVVPGLSPHRRAGRWLRAAAHGADERMQVCREVDRHACRDAGCAEEGARSDADRHSDVGSIRAPLRHTIAAVHDAYRKRQPPHDTSAEAADLTDRTGAPGARVRSKPAPSGVRCRNECPSPAVAHRHPRRTIRG